MHSDISVILSLPRGGGQWRRSIDSLSRQTLESFELILVGFASDVESVDVSELKNVTVTATAFDAAAVCDLRNRGIQAASGDWLVFLDAGDTLESVALELSYTKVRRDCAQIAVFDFKEYAKTDGEFHYDGCDTVFMYEHLTGDECRRALEMSLYLVGCKLYSKAFLTENDIYFSGCSCEDIAFWTKVCLSANKLSLLHSPLYNLSPENAANRLTNSDDFLREASECVRCLPEGKSSDFFGVYDRIFAEYARCFKVSGAKQQKSLATELSRIMSPCDIKACKNELAQRAAKSDALHDTTGRKLRLLSKTMLPLLTFKRRFKSALQPVRHFAAALLKYKIPLSYFFSFSCRPVMSDVILFMGFDYRYTGNSRYLFEELVREGCGGKRLFFVCPPGNVAPQYTVEPYSKLFYELSARAKTVIFESWTVPRMKKREGSVWVQLWHGTPIKRLLFDCAEYDITSTEPRNKQWKFAEIARWDFLLSDCPAANKLFMTCMLFDNDKIVNCGYPRVKYLIESRNNLELKAEIRTRIGVDADKKLVVYLPTWRDYNRDLPVSEQDNSFYLDFDRLLGRLPSEFVIVYKTHFFKEAKINVEREDARVLDGADLDTQQLLLVADFVLTDYSSAVFDALAVDTPIAILCKDFDRYERSRGVYPEVWQKLLPFVCADEEGLAAMLTGGINSEKYAAVKAEYAYQDIGASIRKALQIAER